MSNPAAFTGSIPDTYHRCLGPLLFEPYAKDLTARLRGVKLPPNPHILELACGTGIVTRELLSALPSAHITATDLNEAMLDIARKQLGPAADPRLRFQQADACKLPFPDRSFDIIICQYGVMFFPDKPGAMREARRVLAPGGRYLFNIWDSLEHNPIAGVIQQSLDELFAPNPSRFLAQVPYGWFDLKTIEDTTRAGGFTAIKHDLLTLPSESPSATDAARGFLEGTPNFLAIRDRGITDFTPLRTTIADRLAGKFGKAPCRSTMRAYVVEAS